MPRSETLQKIKSEYEGGTITMKVAVCMVLSLVCPICGEKLTGDIDDVEDKLFDWEEFLAELYCPAFEKKGGNPHDDHYRVDVMIDAQDKSVQIDNERFDLPRYFN